MKKSVSIYLLFCVWIGIQTLQAQCPTDLLSGQNLLTNGDFSDDYNGWTYTADPTRTSGYLIFNPPTTQNYSSPGFIYAGTTPKTFNNSFINFNDHSSSSDNKMLMVDGICTSGIKLWSQSGIAIKPNTTYYFSIWVHALKDANNPPGTLQFDVNGTNLPTTITAPTDIATGWIQYETTWSSGTTPPATATISIENTTTTGCDSYVDFAIDDISFIPGCKYAATGPQPDLGDDQTLCGKGGNPIVLNSNVTHNTTTTVTWSDGTTGMGASAPYTKSITTAGTYSVCVTDNGSCTKSDVIVISNTFTLSLPSNIVLCDPPSALLDPGFTGTGVTYKWEQSTDGTTWKTIPGLLTTTATYTANTTGYYRVTATDPLCGAKTSNVAHITTQQTANPVDAYFCPTSSAALSIKNATGTTYNWYSTATSTTILKTGTSYNTPAISADQTYYVEDASIYTTTVGASALPASGNSQTSLDQYRTQFVTDEPLTIDSVTVYWQLNNSNPNDALKVQFQLTDDPSGTTTPTNVGAASAIFSMTNATASAAGLMKPTFPTTGQTIYAVRVPVNLSVSAAGSYRLTGVSANTTANVEIQQSGMNYVYKDATGGSIISITGTQQGGNPVGTSYYGGMYNWKISHKLNCQRIPVRAIANCALPLDFVAFELQEVAAHVTLSWTLAETGGGYFAIERSQDFFSFEKVGTVAVKNTQKGLESYQFVDTKASSGLYYYRIVQHNADGTTAVSTVKSIVLEGTLIQIAPNPSHGVFTVSGLQEESTAITVYNIQGKEVYALSSDDSNELGSVNIDLTSFVAGIYFVKISTASGQIIEKIIKE